MSIYTRYPVVTGGGGGGGTVTSVGITSGDGLITVTNSPIHTSGNITLTLNPLPPSSVVGGSPNTFAGFDGTGALESIPNWNIDTTFTPSRFGVNANFTIDPFLTTGYNVTNNITSNLIPSADAPNDSEVLLQINTALDPNNSGFGIGATSGLTARILDLSLTAPTSSTNGQVQILNIDTNVGDAVITGGSISNLSPISMFLHQQQGFTVSQISGISTGFQLDIGSSVDSVSIYSANLQVNGALNNFVGYFQAFGNITNTNASTANVNMHSSSVQIDGQLGDVSVFTDFNTLQASANITAEYNSINIGPSAAAGAVIRSYTGINLSPDFSATPITDDITGARIAVRNVTAGTQLTGLDVSISGSTDSDPQGVVGFSCDGRVQVGATTTLTSGQTFQIGNRIEALLTVPPGSPVTGTDCLANNFAGDLEVQDNVALGPIGLGWTSVGFISSLAVASTKTVDSINVFLPAASLPDPGFTTGGNITNMHMIRTFAPLGQGGTVNIANLYGFKIDSAFGDFSSAAVNSWGLYIDSAGAENYIGKSLAIGTSDAKVSNADVALEVGSLKAILLARLTTVQKLALVALEGMVVYDTTLHQMSYYNGTTWVNV